MSKKYREKMSGLRSLLFLSGFVSAVHSATEFSKCCDHGYVWSGGTCDDGRVIPLLDECEQRFILDPEKFPESDKFDITDDGYLRILNVLDSDLPNSTVTYEPHLYCIGRFNTSTSDVALVCFTGGSWYNLRAICSFISVTFIFLTILVYVIVPRLRDLQGICILHSLNGLALAFFSLALMQVVQMPDTVCTIAAFVLYVTFMIAFSWLNVVAFNVWRITVVPNLYKMTDKQWHIFYCIYAYGLPTCLAVGAMSAHLIEGDHIKPGFGEGVCFFSGTVPTWAYFYGPISVLLIVNLVLFVSSSIKLWHAEVQSNATKLRSLRCRFLLTIKLFLIMGLLWIFEVISYAGQNIHKYLNYLWVLTDYLNIMQGVLIFLVLVVFRKTALRGLANNTFVGARLPRSWRTLEDEECSELENSKDTNNPI